MDFRTAKRLNAQSTFYLQVDLPLSYTTHLLDPIEQLSLNFTTPIYICENTVVDILPVTSNVLKRTAAHRS